MQGFTWPEGMEMSLPGGDIRALPGLLGARKKGHILKKSSPKCAEVCIRIPRFCHRNALKQLMIAQKLR